MNDPADAVEALWARSGDAPDLESFLADLPHWFPSEVRAALLVDQQIHSKTPQPWSAEQYAALVLTLVKDDDFTLDLILGEFADAAVKVSPSLQVTMKDVRFGLEWHDGNNRCQAS